MAYTPDQIISFLPRLQQASHCYVGYSGGLDSHVLLHSVVEILGKESVIAIHVNHQLSPNADAWQQHCQQVCRERGVTLITETVQVETAGQGLEAAARDARYQVFERHLDDGGLILLAHHADDQAETVLYRLLRGSGPLGLSGIPISRPLGHGELLRPLLKFTRQELQDYAPSTGLSWIEDESNEQLEYDRNYIRHQVIPKLADRWPDYTSRIATSAALCRDNEQLVDELASQDLMTVGERSERLGWSICIDSFQGFDSLRQGNLLRYWLAQHDFPRPGHQVMTALREELLPARNDGSPQITWGGAQLRRYQHRLYLLPLQPGLPETDEPFFWDVSEPLVLPDKSVLFSRVATGEGVSLPDDALLEVRFRRGGERCRPQGRQGSNNLKILFQEYGLEPWLRDRVPLIYFQDELVAVADLWVCEGFSAMHGKEGMMINWSYPE